MSHEQVVAGKTLSAGSLPKIKGNTGTFFLDPTTGGLLVHIVGGSSGGGPGGGAVTIADGADIALGATADAAATTDSGVFSLISLFKRSLERKTEELVQNQEVIDQLTDANIRLQARIDDSLNGSFVALASASRTSTTSSADFTNRAFSGAHIIVNVTANSGSITPVIEAFDAASGQYYDLLVGPTIIDTGMTVLKLIPGVTGVKNYTANEHVPYIWRVTVAHLNANPVTYSIGANMLN